MDLQDRIGRRCEEGLPENFYSLDPQPEREDEALIQDEGDIEHFEELVASVEKEIRRRKKARSKVGSRILNETDWWRTFLMKPWEYGRTVEQFWRAYEGWIADLVDMNSK